MASVIPAPEFSRPIDVPHSADQDKTHAIAASQAERIALAERFGLVSLGRLEADVRLHRLGGGLVRLSAVFSADLMQMCVVTLEPFAASIEERFTLLFGPGQEGREIVLDGEAETVEPLEDDRIDIGEAVAQQLSLALDPYPRAPDADETIP